MVKFSVASLRSHLRQHLPDYMVPGAFVSLDALPLTPNGKMDRKALPLPADVPSRPETQYVAPRTPTEEVLAGIWADLFGVARVGIHDDFFELGGHSLLATQVASRVRDRFHVDVPLQRLFESSTIAGLAAALDQARPAESDCEPIEPLARHPLGGDRLPLSSAQQRLWFLDHLTPGCPVYNIPAAASIKGQLDVDALRASLNEIVRRHESLRSSFSEEGGRPVLRIAADMELELPLTDLTALSPSDRDAEVRRLAAEEARRPFSLSPAALAACPAPAACRHRARLPPHRTPYRFRRLVDGRLPAGVGAPLSRPFARPAVTARSAAAPICRLRRLAAATIEPGVFPTAA